MNHHNVVLGYTTFLPPTIMVTHELNISVNRWLIFKNHGHITTLSGPKLDIQHLLFKQMKNIKRRNKRN
jgi:hypothetical protein